MREIRLAETAGFCFGVKRAVDMALAASEKYDNCYTFGPIIHNKNVVDMLREKGVYEVSDITGLTPDSTIIIRSHGIGRSRFQEIAEAGMTVVDATCPMVAKIHRIVEEASQNGKLPIIIGEKDHAEVLAVCGWCDKHEIFSTPEQLREWLLRDKNREIDIAVVFQTTGNRENMISCSEIIKKECTSYEIFDTICNATSQRQREAVSLAAECDAMIVVGGRNSANSLRLSEICGQYCKKVFFIETAEELNLSNFFGDDIIGIIAGASTPARIIKEVYDKMSEEIRNTYEDDQKVNHDTTDVFDDDMVEAQEPDDESFAEMLEKSIKTLHTGEKVKGIVAAISQTEISVDLGTKQAGYIPMSELTDDPDVKVEDVVQIGSEVETYVMRVNDVEGTVMLSKKRLDTVKHWDEIETARVEKIPLEGIVVEENKGGIVALVKGVRVFIPASQTGLAKDVPFSTLLRQRVKLRITEVNQSRRRVVGSIKIVSAEERKALAQSTWDSIEIGKKYNGVVKSITSYGAFVDIGGVDGMIHVSELSWSRIKSPADVLKVGDNAEVYVIAFDTEKGKISLGYKDPEANPWKQFTDRYDIGSVVKVKVVKLMQFGAFAEIIPGVDGLIHISQIADRRIGRPDEFLSVGQEIEVKIVDIDFDKHNVSLSIRALIEPEYNSQQKAPVEHGDDDNDSDIVYDTDINKPELIEEEANVAGTAANDETFAQ